MPPFQELHGLQLSGSIGIVYAMGSAMGTTRDDVRKITTHYGFLALHFEHFSNRTSIQVQALGNAAVVKATLDQRSAAFAPEFVLCQQWSETGEGGALGTCCHGGLRC